MTDYFVARYNRTGKLHGFTPVFENGDQKYWRMVCHCPGSERGNNEPWTKPIKITCEADLDKYERFMCRPAYDHIKWTFHQG